MRKTFYALLALFACASVYAQTIVQPAKSSVTLYPSTKPTFKWRQAASAPLGYEFYLSAVLADSTSSTVPVASTVGKNKRYVQVGSSVTDTSVTLDTILVRNTVYTWKVRAKLTNSTWSSWSSPGIFKTGTPAYQIVDGHNSIIKLNHDTVSAVTGIIYIGGSQKQLLDTVYNTAKFAGLGATNTTRDTLVAWSEAAGKNVYTYQNKTKYGVTGSKILTIAYDASGITVDDSLSIETGKPAVTLTSAWKPGGDFANDNVIFMKTAPAKTALTYPSSIGSIGPDSIKFMAMWDKNQNEYFGFKSDSLFAAKDSQQTSVLKSTFSLTNTSGALKGYKISFAVRKTRAEYFDAWADNRPIFVSNLTAQAADTLARGLVYVKFESYGAKLDTLQYSANGTTFVSPAHYAGQDTSSFIDSVQYRVPDGVYGTTSVIKFISTKNDVALSAAFKANDRYITVTNPLVTDSFVPDSQLVIWTNKLPVAVTKVEFSTDSGATWGGTRTIAGGSTKATDTLKVYLTGKSANCFVRVFNAVGDTGISARFTLQRYITVLSPKVTDSFKPDSQYVVWNNFTGNAITKVSVSKDSGVTYSAPITVSSTATKDSLLFYFNGKSTNCFVKVTNGGLDTAYSARFTLQRYITVSKPSVGQSVPAGTNANIIWDNYTGVAVTGVKISLDSGTTWIGAVTVNSTKKTDTLSYLFEGAKVDCSNVFALVTTGAADTGKSARFTVASGGAKFTLTPSFGDPGSSVQVPVTFLDGVAGDSLKAFDFLITFDSSIVHYHDYTLDPKLQNSKWMVAVDSSHKSGANSYVRVSGFKLPAGAGIKSSELMKLGFTINNKQSNIGSTAVLDITNGVLSAAGNNALSLNTSTTVNGSIGVYSSVAGKLKYMHGKYDDSPTFTISGDSLVSYVDKGKAANNAVYGVTAGAYLMSSREPNDTIVVTPAASKYMASGLASIDVTDAQLAFRDWVDTLQVRARIAADVNNDSLINVIDAMAIMEASVDSTYFSRVGTTNWIFVDSTSLAGFESSTDSLTSWFTQQRHSITSKLVNQQTNQDFFGVLRGDIDFSFNAAAIKTMKKSHAAPVLFSTNEKINARPGDTVWIPLSLTLNGEAIGGFNSTLQVDPTTFTYTGQFKTGATVPQNKNWYITARADAKGLLRVAGTDFSMNINPITQDGPALLFKYIVNKDAKKGVATPINVNAITVVDGKLQSVASSTKGGQAEISRMGSTVVTEYALAQNYPNPFNPSTTIEYALPKDSKVDITIYNIIGQKVATLFSGVQTVGFHQVDFNASQMSSGIYFYTIKASSVNGDQNFTSVKKMMLLK